MPSLKDLRNRIDSVKSTKKITQAMKMVAASKLKKAQSLGYAEPGNPKLDLNGYDTLAKVQILSSLSFNKKISKKNYLMEGIENLDPKDFVIAEELNLRIKLLGITEIINKQLFERVHPCLVKKILILAMLME